MTNQIKTYFPYILPLLLIFSRSLADITIVFVSILFIYYSYKEIGWEWIKEKWFLFAVFFSIYCMTVNSFYSVNSFESFAYSFFFLRWPIFSMALSYWILSDFKSLNKFLKSLSFILLFLIFDTWWQFFFGLDIFGLETFSSLNRLTGPLNGPHVGTWISKLILIPPLILVLYGNTKLKEYQNYFIYGFFIISTLLFLTVFITGERMALLLSTASILIFFIGLVLNKSFTYKLTFILSILSIFIVLTFAYSFPSTTQRAFFSTINKIIYWKSSDYGLVWQSAYDVWMQSPFFGVGLHKYREACENLGYYGTSYLEPIGSGVCFHPHNISLQLLSETGIVGFILFYSMVTILTFSSLKVFLRKKLWIPFAIFFNILFSCFLPIASSTSFFSNKYGAIIWLLIGVMLATNKLFLQRRS